MLALKDALDKAMNEQYPPGTPNNFQMIYGRENKKSQRARWSDHFALQLKSNGYQIMPIGATYHGEGPYIVFPEFKFHPDRQWRMDFAIPFTKISIEIEGGIWMKGGGAHSRPMNILRDVEKQNAAVMLGYAPLRFTDKEIKNGTSIDLTMKLTKVLLSSKTK